jgi:hypothetical protein
LMHLVRVIMVPGHCRGTRRQHEKSECKKGDAGDQVLLVIDHFVAFPEGGGLMIPAPSS